MRNVTRILAAGIVMAAWTMPAAAQGDAAKGQELFAAQKCSMCHAVAGKGNAKHPLDGAGAKLDEAMVRLWLTDPKAAEAKSGKKAMPPMKSFKSLPAADIDALVAYVMSLK